MWNRRDKYKNIQIISTVKDTDLFNTLPLPQHWWINLWNCTRVVQKKTISKDFKEDHEPVLVGDGTFAWRIVNIHQDCQGFQESDINRHSARGFNLKQCQVRDLQKQLLCCLYSRPVEGMLCLQEQEEMKEKRKNAKSTPNYWMLEVRQRRHLKVPLIIPLISRTCIA